ncbi:MAG: 8-amino-7-oxononanoate synthase [Geobacteraceae bacterium]|nr:8-amino-7-oxononanoate synthase [Geobacteraceae bacterium]
MSLQLLSQRLEKIRHDGLYRSLRSVDRTTPQVLVEDRQALLFCSNNYLGLAEHPALAQAAADAALQYGTSSAASRLVSGNQPLHELLETKLAAWKGTETALLFNSGYAANTGIIAALAGRGDIIFSDRLNHASIIDGALLSGSRLIRYPHNDTLALARLLEQHQGDGLRLIVTDGVFSMDGDIAPLQEIADLAEQHTALLMVDDAHAGGVLGQQGRGSVDFCGVAGRVAIQMGTFGKALGSFGAYAACSRLVRDYLINRSRSLIFSTSLPPTVLAASAAAVDLVQTEEGQQLRQRLADNSNLLRSLLQQAGYKVPDGSTPIVPILIGDAATTTRFSTRLLEEGIFVQGIRPPTVPKGTSRLRCTVMASHSPDQIQQAAAAIIRIGRELGVL